MTFSQIKSGAVTSPSPQTKEVPGSPKTPVKTKKTSTRFTRGPLFPENKENNVASQSFTKLPSSFFDLSTCAPSKGRFSMGEKTELSTPPKESASWNACRLHRISSSFAESFQHNEEKEVEFKIKRPRETKEKAELYQKRPKTFSDLQASPQSDFNLGRISWTSPSRDGESKDPTFEKEPVSNEFVPRSSQEAQIIDGKFILNGEEHQVKLIGSGQHHRVYEFTNGAVVEIKKKEIDLSKVVLRVYNVGGLNPAKLQLRIKEDYKAYDQLSKDGLPLPEVFENGLEFEDKVNPKNGNFWLIEKMSQEVSCRGWENGEEIEKLDNKDIKVLNFVKEWIKKGLENKCEFIGDFYRRNLMWNSKGELCVVDFSDIDKEDWEKNLESQIVAWAAGNQHVEKFLRS